MANIPGDLGRREVWFTFLGGVDKLAHPQPD